MIERTTRAAWNDLNARIIACEACPRLRAHCAAIANERRAAYADWTYWGRPIPNFGPAGARLLIVGLAPAAHGANRTGRMFTGDRSGQWLFRALHKAGFANQSTADSIDDGLQLNDCAITATCHCAPPDNKPTLKEVSACRPWLTEAFSQTPARVVLALGGIAWKACLTELRARGVLSGRQPKFGHCAEAALSDGSTLLGSFHPSQQNTFTGRLTEPMFDAVFYRVRLLLANDRSPVAESIVRSAGRSKR